MARLPEVPRRGELTRAPSHSASAEVVASPWQGLAVIFGEAGEKLQDISNEMAPAAGANAVTRDENGDVSVRFMVPATQYARNYNRAAAGQMLALQASGFQTSAAEMARRANGDAASFQSMWAEFSRVRIERAPAMARAGTVQLLDEIGQAQFRGIASSAYDRTITTSYRDQVAYRARLADQLLTLASQGGAGTPEWEQMAQRYGDIGREISTNPNFNIGAGEIEVENERVFGRARIEAVRYEVLSRFPLNPGEGLAYAADALNAVEGLTPAERREALADINRGYTAQNSLYEVQRSELRGRVDDMVSLLVNSLPYDDAGFTALMRDAATLNDPTSIARLNEAALQRGIIDHIEAVGPAGAGAWWGAMTGDTAPLDFLGERAAGSGVRFEGINPVFAGQLANLIAAAEAETGERVTINSGGRTSEQQAQLYANYLLTTGQGDSYTFNGVTYYGDPGNPVGLAAPPGQSRHESGAAADIQGGAALEWMHAHAADYGLEFLSGQAFIDDPGHIQLAGDFTPPPAGITPQILTEVRTTIGDQLRVMLGGAEDVFDQFNRGLDPAAAQTAIRLAQIVDDPDLTARVDQLLRRSQGAFMAAGMQPDQIEAMRAELLAAAGGGDAAAAAWIDEGVAARQTYIDGLRADGNAYREGITRELHGVVPIDMTNAETIAATLPARAQAVAVTERAQNLPPQGIFEPGEAAAFGRALATAPADQQIAVLTAMSTVLPAATMIATLGQISGEAPELAVAAHYAAAGGSDEVMRRLLAEQQLAAEPGYRPPAREGAREAAVVSATYGAAFSDLPAHAQRVEGLAFTVFASMARERGIPTDLSTDASRTLYARALQMAAGASFENGVQLGGVVPVNGISTLVPIGVSADAFVETIANLTDRQLAALGGPPMSGNAVPVEARDIRAARFVAVGDGVYRVARGLDDTGAPMFYATEAGDFWTIDARALAELPRDGAGFGAAVDAARAGGAAAAVIVEQMRAAGGVPEPPVEEAPPPPAAPAAAPATPPPAPPAALQQFIPPDAQQQLDAARANQPAAAGPMEELALMDGGRAPGFVEGTPEYARARQVLVDDPPDNFAALNRENFAAWQIVLNLSRPEMIQRVAELFGVTTEEVRDRVWPY